MAGVVRRPRCSPGLGPGERSRARAPCLNSASCKKATICLPPRLWAEKGRREEAAEGPRRLWRLAWAVAPSVPDSVLLTQPRSWHGLHTAGTCGDMQVVSRCL